MDDEDATWDDRGPDSEDAVIGVCWYCGAKLREGYDYDVGPASRLHRVAGGWQPTSEAPHPQTTGR